MRIKLKKLEAMGVKYDYKEKEQTITFFSDFHHTQAHKLVVDLADMLEFSDSESDELMSAVYRLQMLNAIKKASGA